MQDIEIPEEFDGVFRFTNPMDREFVHLWNNKEYRFPPLSTVPMIIMGEPLENIQEIRKRFAFDNALERFYESPQYMKMKEMGNGLPPTFDNKILEPMIEECLKPLTVGRAKIKEGKKDDNANYRSTKALTDKDNPNFIFAEENKNPPVLGVMSDKA